ncbi:chitinase [Metarhizium anisopliae]|uniref:Chitin-binding type-1 domain-containing protein n=1 Tax=Metarhizium anisopliae BRIP 53293 TaxID=1291518 RepID=A0A0D9NPB3_METAN|nr:chitinase [Metarhizium anisopliae]KJK75902.1 hypothetical protein H634G_09267 [Metarhizium anisopliae BRIP 53293]
MARICLSDGYPPMPEPVPNAECGPTVAGTNNPAREVDLAGLNPCPLKACCNFWGHCGTTSQFCSKAGGNMPPTLACTSNCGTDIVKSPPPAEFKRVAYFEGFSTKRSSIKTDSSQKIETSDTQYQWKRFKDLKTKMKKITSFGGWSFSAEAPNCDVFQSGMRPENRETLATNIADFVTQNNIDGVDIDWYVFQRPESGAKKAPCTDTAGYISNAEIQQIAQNGAPGLKQYTDNSDSDVLVFGDNWVAYMTDDRKAKRTARYKDLNFGGVSDWAVDLGAFYRPIGGSLLPYSSMGPILQGCDKYEGQYVTQA